MLNRERTRRNIAINHWADLTYQEPENHRQSQEDHKSKIRLQKSREPRILASGNTHPPDAEHVPSSALKVALIEYIGDMAVAIVTEQVVHLLSVSLISLGHSVVPGLGHIIQLHILRGVSKGHIVNRHRIWPGEIMYDSLRGADSRVANEGEECRDERQRRPDNAVREPVPMNLDLVAGWVEFRVFHLYIPLQSGLLLTLSQIKMNPGHPANEPPPKSTSAPIDSKMLFAPMVTNNQNEFAQAFSEMDLRNEPYYEEFYDQYKNQYSIPPPLAEPEALTDPTQDHRSRSNSLLVNNVAKAGMQDDEKSQSEERHAISEAPPFQPVEVKPVSQMHSYIPEFTPAFAYVPYPMGYTKESVYTHALSMATDQLGCRFLQLELEEGDTNTIQTIFDQIFYQFPQLMTDPFGNYLCQKILEVIPEDRMEDLLTLILPHLTLLSMNTHGTRSVQKLVEVCAQNQVFASKLIASLELKEIINDVNGNHVVQKCLSSFDDAYKQFIYDEACAHTVEIATQRHGCCVLQRAIDAASLPQMNALVDRIVTNSVMLVQDAFGNYVVQYVIDLNDFEVNARLGHIFIENMKKLSTQKFSSNVVEKCIQQNSEPARLEMIKEIGKRENIAVMIVDQYANYGKVHLVVQRALSMAPAQLQKEMIDQVKMHAEDMKRDPCGKRVLPKLMKTYPMYFRHSQGDNYYQL